MVDWNTVLDPNLDRGGLCRATNNLDAKYFGEFIVRFDLVDNFRKRHPTKVEWTLAGKGTPGRLSCYLNRVLGESISCPSFEVDKNYDNKLLYALIRLDKAKIRMYGYGKFNASLLDEKNFQDQLKLILMIGAIFGNSWWTKIKDRIRSFAIDYSSGMKSVRK